MFARWWNQDQDSLRNLAHFAEFGIVAPVGRNGVETLLRDPRIRYGTLLAQGVPGVGLAEVVRGSAACGP
jgi:hypothetical protein